MHPNQALFQKGVRMGREAGAEEIWGRFNNGPSESGFFGAVTNFVLLRCLNWLWLSGVLGYLMLKPLTVRDKTNASICIQHRLYGGHYLGQLVNRHSHQDVRIG